MGTDINEIYSWIGEVGTRIEAQEGGMSCAGPETLLFFQSRYKLSDSFDQEVAHAGVNIFDLVSRLLLNLDMPLTMVEKNTVATVANMSFMAGAEHVLRNVLPELIEQAQRTAEDASKFLDEG